MFTATSCICKLCKNKHDCNHIRELVQGIKDFFDAETMTIIQKANGLLVVKKTNGGGK